MQTSYPIFETGQVLSASHLNDLADYLEEQDRLTRNKLIGIGIACGLEVDFDAAENEVRVTSGCAVTSQGYLLVHEEQRYDRARPYTLPVPSLEEAPDTLFDGAPYPFFHDANGKQIEIWELLTVDFEPSPSEPTPTAVDAAFVADRVALLFLETNLESLKNCDINDCGDRGSEIEFTPRMLLVSRADAQAMLDREAEIAKRPVDRHNHPGYPLEELRVEKLRLAANDVDGYPAFVLRILEIAVAFGPAVSDALGKSYEAFRYLLEDGYPEGDFSGGPFSDPGYFSRVVSQLARNLVMCPYFYGYMTDVADSYNEFLRAAIALDTECCPDENRFPLHVLLGEVRARPTAFAGDPGEPGFDPLSANADFAPSVRPLRFRHHFVPSPIHGEKRKELERVRSLHYRTYLLAYRFTTDGLLDRDIRITPSREDDVPLSDTAIPFYYALGEDPAADDLVRNWSYTATVNDRLDHVYSHAYIDEAAHPLAQRMGDHRLYRIEGAIGKGLGAALRSILEQKRSLGLSFGVEPVYVGLAMAGDERSESVDREAREAARQVLAKMLVCRMRDLDVVFLVMMATLFQYLVAIITLLSRTNTGVVAGVVEEEPAVTTGPASRFPAELQLLRDTSGMLLREYRSKPYTKGAVTTRVATENDPQKAIGMVYEEVKSGSTSANLFDRTRAFIRRAGFDQADEVTQRIYPAVSLLDKAEDLVETVSVSSLAEFDFKTFEQRYDAFVQAFDTYLEEEAPAARTKAQRAVRDELQRTYGAIAATTPQAVLSGLTNQLNDRMAALFSELALSGYTRRHPGAEHRAGVPEGGTLVLLYTHRSFLVDLLEQQRELLQKHTERVAARMARTSGGASVDAKRLREVRGSQDPMDTFVVIGDLCIPYLCCDSDCSEMTLEPVRPRPRRPGRGIVRGTVFLGEGVREISNVNVLERATMVVTDAATREPVDVTFDRGSYEFAAPPGTYRIEVRGPRGAAPVERLVTIGAGGAVTEDLMIRKETRPSSRRK